MCPHGGTVQTISSDVRVTVMGMPVATMVDQFLVAGCAFMTGPTPTPCLRVQWLTGATRVLVTGLPPVTALSTGLAFLVTGAPGGPPIIVQTQPRVSGL